MWRSLYGVKGAGSALSRMVCTAVHQYNRLHENIRPNQTFSDMELPAVRRYQISIRETTATTFYSQQEGTVLTDKESDAFPIKRGTKQGDPTVLPYSSTQYCNIHWKVIWIGGKKNKKESDWATKLRTAWRTWDLLTTYYSSPSRSKGCGKCYVNFKTSTEAVGLWIHPDKTKMLSNQDKVKAKEITVDNIKIEILEKRDSAKYLGAENHVRGAGNRRDQKQAKSSVGQRSTNIVRDWHRKPTAFATDFAFSTW